MKAKEVGSIPKAKDTEAKLRRDKVREILIDAYNSGAAVIEVENDGEFPSMQRMREIFNQEGSKAEWELKLPHRTFRSNVKCGLLYVTIKRAKGRCGK